MDRAEFNKDPNSSPHIRLRLGGRSQRVPGQARVGGGSPGEWLNVLDLLPEVPPTPPTAEKPQLTVPATHKTRSCGPRHSSLHTPAILRNGGLPGKPPDTQMGPFLSSALGFSCVTIACRKALRGRTALLDLTSLCHYSPHYTSIPAKATHRGGPFLFRGENI